VRIALRRTARLMERPDLRSVRPRRPSTEIASVVTYDGEDHALWPFDGEYWRDEFGSYRERVNATCGADRARWELR